MTNKSNNSIGRRQSILCGAFSLTLAALTAGAASDLSSAFDADAEAWRASDAGAALTWQASGGNPVGYLQASGPGGVWHLVSPAAWAVDWSEYQALKFDLAIPGGHYPTSDTADMVVIPDTKWRNDDLDRSDAVVNVDALRSGVEKWTSKTTNAPGGTVVTLSALLFATGSWAMSRSARNNSLLLPPRRTGILPVLLRDS